MGTRTRSHLDRVIYYSLLIFLQCFDTVGLVTGRASGLQKSGCWFVGDDLTRDLHVVSPVITTTSIILAKVDASVFVVIGVAVDLLRSVTCLGVSIDQELTFADHIRSLACRCFYWIRQLYAQSDEH